MKPLRLNINVPQLVLALCCLMNNMSMTACKSNDFSLPENPPQEEQKPTEPIINYCKIEAENASLAGNLKVSQEYTGYSGSGYVADFSSDKDILTFNIPAIEAGTYELFISYYCMYDGKKNYVSINQNRTEFDFPKNDTFSEIKVSKLSFSKTEGNTISISKSWGYFAVDYIILKPAQNTTFQITTSLATPNPSQEATELYQYLLQNFGKKILSGQTGDKESETIKKITGKTPLIRAFDFMDYSPSRIEFGASSSDSEKAIAWNEQGGIVTIAWHWNAPKDLINSDEHPWWSGFYTNATTFDVEYAMNNPESEDYQLILRDIDAIAIQLKKLQAQHVPVLWRPLHEAAGKWFWWGAKGAEPCVKLYRLLFDRLVNHHKINNLIWVWTSDNANNALDWYPGDEYVDIIGADIYMQGNHSSHALYFETLKDIYQGKKMIVVSENGSIPNPKLMFEDQAIWGYFVTWSGEFIEERHNPESYIKEVYNNENVISLEDYTKNK